MRSVNSRSAVLSGVPLGTSGRSVPRWRRRLVCLLASRPVAIVRIVVSEIGNLPRRIADAILCMSQEGETAGLVDPEPGQSPLPIQYACNADMRKRRPDSGQSLYDRMNRRLYSQGYADGARWMGGSIDTRHERKCLPLSPRKIPSAESISPP